MRKAHFCLILLFFIPFFSLFAQDETELKVQIEQATLNNDSLNLSRAWFKMGKFYDQQGQIAKSNQALQVALFWANSIQNNKAKALISNYLASNYSLTGESDSAIFYYNLAIKACEIQNDSLTLSAILINLGDEYSNLGNYIEAANRSLKALKIKESAKDSTNLAFYYQKVGEIYKSAGQIEKWEEYIKKAYHLISYENGANTSAIAAIYNDLGGIAEKKGNYKQALAYYDTLISIATENHFEKAIAVALSNSATIYKQLGEVEKALETAIKNQEYKNESAYQNIYDKNRLAELYLANNNIQQARHFIKLAIADKNLNYFPNEKMRAYKTFYEIEKKDKNFEQALFWNEKYKLLYDSIRDSDVRTRIVDLEVAYQTEKKEQQIELLTTENRLKNQRLNIGIILLAALVIVIFMILYILQIRKKQANLIQADLQQQVLRTQMNPHFIFNVLGSIQNYMLQNNNRAATKFLAQFATLIRATLNNSVAETIPLAQEINMLQNYMELEQMRLGNTFDYKLFYDDDLEIDFIQIPPMLIQPFIENAIKHGFKNLTKRGILTLRIIDKTNWIEFIIEDNGPGFQTNHSKTKEHQSMALKIFEKRRNLIQQKYKKKFSFEMQDINDFDPDKSGVRIRIDLPVIENYL